MSASRSSTRAATSARDGVDGTSRSAMLARFSGSVSTARTRCSAAAIRKGVRDRPQLNSRTRRVASFAGETWERTSSTLSISKWSRAATEWEPVALETGRSGALSMTGEFHGNFNGVLPDEEEKVPCGWSQLM